MPYLIKAMIHSGDLAEAEMQLQFAKDMAAESEKAELELSEAIVTYRRSGDADAAIGHLEGCGRGAS